MTRQSSMSKLCHALACSAFALTVLPITTASADDSRTARKDRWAVINLNGTVARCKGCTSASSLGGGSYQVVFTKNVAACSYQATIGNAASGNPPLGQIGTSPRSGNVNAVFITTFNSAGTATAAQFHLYVKC